MVSLDESHLGGAYPNGDNNTIMPDIWGYLLIKYDIKSVIDIGCGFGHCIKWWADIGMCDVFGVDGWQEAIDKNLMPNNVVRHDYTTGLVATNLSFDLAWSSEFVEHVDEKFIPNFMHSFKLAKYIVITHAVPNQGGHHHVNEKDSDWWIKQFDIFGLKYNPIETSIMRKSDRRKAPWGKKTLMFFNNENWS